MTYRPTNFVFNNRHDLAQGLIFAILGNGFYTNTLIDSSKNKNNFPLDTFMDINDWKYANDISRFSINFDTGVRCIIPNLNHNIGYGDFTWSFWCQFNGTNTGYLGAMSSGSYSPGIYPNYGGKITFYWGGAHPSNLTITPYIWQHIVARKQNGFINIFLNGVKDVDIHSFSVHQMLNTTFQIGSGTSIGEYLSVGILADIIFYNRALSDGEIQQLANPSNYMLSGMLQYPKRKYYYFGSRPPRKRFNVIKGIGFSCSY